MKKVALIGLLCFTSGMLASQEIEVSVLLGSECAEFAFVKVNSEYAGICDSSGRIRLTRESLSPGDTIHAEYAGIKSDRVIHLPDTERYALRIEAEELASAKIEARDMQVCDEYLKLVHRLKYKYLEPGDKFQLSFEFNYAKGPFAKKSGGRARFAYIHKKNIKEASWYQLLPDGDSLSTEYCAFALGNANNTLISVLFERYFRQRYMDNDAWIHKVVTSDEDLCYILLEGEKRDKQTVIKFDRSGRLAGLSRAFVGPGAMIWTTEKGSHDLVVQFEQQGNRIRISDVVFKGFVPEKDNLKYQIHCHDIVQVPLTKEERKVVMEKVKYYE